MEDYQLALKDLGCEYFLT